MMIYFLFLPIVEDVFLEAMISKHLVNLRVILIFAIVKSNALIILFFFFQTLLFP